MGQRSENEYAQLPATHATGGGGAHGGNGHFRPEQNFSQLARFALSVETLPGCGQVGQ